MTLENQCKQLAATLGVEIESEYFPYDRNYDIQVAAPDGMQWASGQCIHLVAVYYTYDKGGKNEAYYDLLMRMKEGVEPIDKLINP